MRLRQNDTLLALRRIQGFITQYKAVLGTIPTAGASTDIDASVAALTAQALTQKSSKETAVGATNKMKSLRATLLQTNMAPIAAIAKAKIALTPELAALAMPKPGTHSQPLITAANSMATTAAPFAATFTTQGLAPDFLTQLQAAATALQTAIDSRAAVKTSGVSATKGAVPLVQTARQAIKALNAQVVAQLGTTNPTVLAAWQNTKKISSKPGVALGSTQTITVNPVPATAAAASTPAASGASTAAASAPATPTPATA